MFDWQKVFNASDKLRGLDLHPTLWDSNASCHADRLYHRILFWRGADHRVYVWQSLCGFVIQELRVPITLRGDDFSAISLVSRRSFIPSLHGVNCLACLVIGEQCREVTHTLSPS